jgi:hypothetical protein
MSPIGSTNAAIIDDLRRQRRRQVERDRVLQPIRAVDSLIDELEELHLGGRKRVPDGFLQRLDALNATLPSDLRVEPRARVTIVHLMDRLYEVQDALFSRKSRTARLDVESDNDDINPLPEAS